MPATVTRTVSVPAPPEVVPLVQVCCLCERPIADGDERDRTGMAHAICGAVEMAATYHDLPSYRRVS
jgi:hypothetical protein